MPQTEHNEWPTFNTVLRDVDTPEPNSDVVVAEPGLSVQVEEDPASVLAPSFCDDLLPEPLAPIDIDTSAVRALLLAPSSTADEEFDLRALDPLDPPEVLGPLETEDHLDTASTFEPPSVFDLAFTDDEVTPLETSDEISLYSAPQFANDTTPAIEDIPSGAVFELDEATIAATEEAVSDTFTTPAIDLFDLLATDDDTDQSNGFDSIATANAIEGELNALSDLTALETDFVIGVDDTSSEPADLDNVIPIRPAQSTDDENVDAVRDLSNNEWAEPTDSPAAPLSHAAPDGQQAARVSQTGWVGLEPEQAETTPQVEDKIADPWAHMRPTDEPQSVGLLAKIFGGEERRQAKARRRAKERAEAESGELNTEAEPDFDSACPNCGGECQVDLDDPIGRRMHVSCPSCDHMWFTPYVDDAHTG